MTAQLTDKESCGAESVSLLSFFTKLNCYWSKVSRDIIGIASGHEI
jgi:hypothetical protein